MLAVASGEAVFEDAEIAGERLPWGREEARLERQLQGRDGEALAQPDAVVLELAAGVAAHRQGAHLAAMIHHADA